ncbi:MAG TPA: hypothetical protein VF109_11380 [Mycobacteriales bacterium]
MTAAHAPVPPDGPDPADPFAVAVRAGICAAGLTLRQLADRLAPYGELRSSIATLSDWRNGLCHPTPGELGRTRVLALERCLGLPAGDLLLLLPSTPTTYPSRASQVGLRPVDPLTVRRTALLREVGRQVGPQRVIPVSVEKEFALGWLTAPVMTTVTTTVRALHDGVDRYLFTHAADPRLHPRLVAVHGCAIGPEHRETAPAGTAALSVVELRFDRTLRRGDRYEFAYAVGYGAEDVAPALCEPLFRHVQLEPCERLSLRLTAQPDWQPAGVLECRWPKPRDLAAELRHPARRDAGGFRQTHLDPVPAGYGWRWLRLKPGALVRDRRFPAGPDAA